jgi:hypothetical protein
MQGQNDLQNSSILEEIKISLGWIVYKDPNWKTSIVLSTLIENINHIRHMMDTLKNFITILDLERVRSWKEKDKKIVSGNDIIDIFKKQIKLTNTTLTNTTSTNTTLTDKMIDTRVKFFQQNRGSGLANILDKIIEWRFLNPTAERNAALDHATTLVEDYLERNTVQNTMRSARKSP